MTKESTRVSSCILNPVSLAETYPWDFEDETPAIVRDYFNAVGIMEVLDEQDFEQSLLQHCGLDATEYLKVAKDKASRGERAESIKAGNLELALAVRSQLDGTRYEEYFSWLAAANLPQPSRVLDIGSDIGVSTCFYAMLFPEATITGVDKSADAIACAKKLAAKLQLKNIDFVHVNSAMLSSDLKGQRFDLVFATRVTSDMSDDFPYHGDTVEDVLAWQRPSASSDHKTPRAQPLANLLTDDKSTLVSLERVFTPHDLAEWLRSLRDDGIYVPWESVDLVDYFDTEYDFDDELLLMIGSKQPAELPTAVEIRSLWTGGLDQIPDQDVYENVEAESVFVATEPKECRDSFLRESDDGNHVTTELWETSSHVLIYKYDMFDRKLVRLPADVPGHVIELLKEVLDDDREDS